MELENCLQYRQRFELDAGKSIMTSPWPQKCDTACWWCCHKFDTVPIPLPVHYDELRNVFNCIGTFCSFGCAKTFNLIRNSVRRDRTCTLLTLFRNKVIKKDAAYPLWNALDTFGITAAGNRYTLRLFGGPKSIEEFREGLHTCWCTSPRQRPSRAYP
jgi:hypothetical protein